MTAIKIPLRILEINEELNNQPSERLATQEQDSEGILAFSGCHIFIRITFRHQTSPFLMIVDTGASKTVLDSNLGSEIIRKVQTKNEIQSSGVNSAIQMELGFINELKIASLIVRDFPVGLTDLSYINSIYQRFCDEPIAGLIGGDFLLRYKARINYEKLVLYLKHPSENE